MRLFVAVGLYLAIIWGTLTSSGADAVVDEITLYVPAFAGPESLGQNVATVLNLQVWQTFRRAPSPNPKKLDFGKGKVIWDNRPLEIVTHEYAESRTSDLYAQMVMWGKAYSYGDGVVVQTYLSIPDYDDFRETKLERWQVSLAGKTIVVDLPRRRHEMAPIHLSRNVIARYSSPSALEIYDEHKGGTPKGAIGDTFVALQFESDAAKVMSDTIKGWVRLPVLSENRTEVVDFVGGVVRIFRGDWEGATRLMQQVINNPNTRISLKIDAYLYLAMALARQHLDGYPPVEKALELNPFNRRAVEYAIMCDLVALTQTVTGPNHPPKAAVLAHRIVGIVEANRDLFQEDDPWLRDVLQVAKKYQ